MRLLAIIAAARADFIREPSDKRTDLFCMVAMAAYVFLAAKMPFLLCSVHGLFAACLPLPCLPLPCLPLPCLPLPCLPLPCLPLPCLPWSNKKGA